MYETLYKSEERINNRRYNDVRLNRAQEQASSDLMNFNVEENITPYLPINNYQNDVYTTPYSDNINMNHNDYNMYNMNQQANMFMQATYQPNYYDYQNAYNNISAQAQTRPTAYYQVPQQTPTHNIFRTVQPIEQQMNYDEEYEIVQPQKTKKGIRANKMIITFLCVYMALVVMLSALLIVNKFAASSAAAVDAGSTQVEVQESNIRYLQKEDGSIVELSTEKNTNYTYEVSTNWFDKLCDKIGSKLG